MAEMQFLPVRGTARNIARALAGTSHAKEGPGIAKPLGRKGQG